LTRKRLERASKLTSGLADEGVRWGATAKALEASTKLLIGDVFLASGYIAYLGAFTGSFRWGSKGGGERGNNSGRQQREAVGWQSALRTRCMLVNLPLAPSPRPVATTEPPTRDDLMRQWVAGCQARGIPTSSRCTLRGTLASPVEAS
jgi:hypothetical protein